jgi:hypothetical protein
MKKSATVQGKKILRTLRLHKQTLRLIEVPELGNVQGAGVSNSYSTATNLQCCQLN